jgi:flagellar hook-associated protein 3 FlgL
MMRLSTSTIYQTGLNGILRNESDVLSVQQQLSAGRRVVTPSDDPLAAGQAVTASTNLSMTNTYASNRDAANRSLGLESNALTSIVSALTDVMTRVVQAGNGTLADTDRNTLSTVLTNSRDALLGLANSTDGNGQYLFSGTTGEAAAYVQDPVSGAITYNGSAGQRLIQVEQTRQMPGSDIGSDIFDRASPGASAYIVSANGTPTGTAQFSAANVTPTGPNVGDDFQIDFALDGTGAMTYTITNLTAGTPPSAPVAYQDGAAIDMGGVAVTFKGAPASGDSFTVATAQSSDLDMFGTLDSLITALKQPLQDDPTAAANLTNMLATAGKKLAINLDNVSTVQASVGARQNELDALDTTGNQRFLTDKNSLGNLVDVDYYSAVSDMSLRQLALQASMAAFSAVKGTSLFSMK